jgi:hypothetical protein
MSKKEQNIWNLTDTQFKILQNCAKINSILYFNGNNPIVSTNALDESFTVFYINTQFDFNVNKSFVIHNLNELIKTLKMMEKGNIEVTDDRIIITDENGKIKCKYLYANSDIVENLKPIFEGYNDIISSIKNSDGCIKLEFKKEYFEVIRKFLNPNYNTISIQNNKIILFDNIGNIDTDKKDNIEIELENVNVENRIDIDVSLFKSIEEDTYDCYLSPSGFILFENTETNNIYGVAANIIE